MRKKVQILLLITFGLLILSACAGGTASEDENDKHVKLGVNASQIAIWEVLKELALEEGIEIELVQFSDYNLPNDALVNREIEMNAFQSLAFLAQYNVANDADIIPIGSYTGVPKGVYSEKYNDSSDIPEGSRIAVSNDPMGLGLDLRLLQGAGLIELKDSVGAFADVDDIVKNPKNLDIFLLQSEQVARVLKDVAAAALYSSTAGHAGLDSDNPLYMNDPTSDEERPYLGAFAVRAEDKDKDILKTIVDLYQEPEILEAVEIDTYGTATVIHTPVKIMIETVEELMEELRENNK